MQTYRQFQYMYDMPDSAIAVVVEADQTARVRSKHREPNPQYVAVREAIANAHTWAGQDIFYDEVVVILEGEAEWDHTLGTLS